MIFFFQRYEVAAYLAGIVSVKIPQNYCMSGPEHFDRRKFFGVVAGGVASLAGVGSEAHANSMEKVIDRSLQYTDALEDLFSSLKTGDAEEVADNEGSFEQKFRALTEAFLHDYADLCNQQRSDESDLLALKDIRLRVAKDFQMQEILKIKIVARLEREISDISRRSRKQ